MRIGLIDVDGHNFPNLYLMKKSAQLKSQGHTVEWWSADGGHYDEVYMSKVFSDAYSPDVPTPENATRVYRGGTGYYIDTIDGVEIFSPKHKHEGANFDRVYPDYGLYPQYTQDHAYGFLTRGCPRGCPFCIVGKKEGLKSRKVADVTDFWNGQKWITCCDPNILACKQSVSLLTDLQNTGAKVHFNQGLDARLLTEHTAELLADISINTHFAMDRMDDIDNIVRGLTIYRDVWKERHPKRKWRDRDNTVFVLTNYETSHEEDMMRIHLLEVLGYQPCISIYDKPSAPRITKRLARYVNNRILYRSNDTFADFLKGYKKP